MIQKMSKIENDIDQSFEKYEKVRECLSGLSEILSINFRENNIYHQLSMDNIKALHKNVVDILNMTHTPRKVRMRIREIENTEKELGQELLL